MVFPLAELKIDKNKSSVNHKYKQRSTSPRATGPRAASYTIGSFSVDGGDRRGGKGGVTVSVSRVSDLRPRLRIRFSLRRIVTWLATIPPERHSSESRGTERTNDICSLSHTFDTLNSSQHTEGDYMRNLHRGGASCRYIEALVDLSKNSRD